MQKAPLEFAKLTAELGSARTDHRQNARRQQYAAELLDGLQAWMARKGFATVDEVRGLLAAPPPPPADPTRERAGYVAALRAAYAPW